MTFRSDPKPEKKEKVKDPFYWSKLKNKSAKKKIEKMKPDTTEYEAFSKKLWKEREHRSQLPPYKTLPYFNPHSEKFLNQIRYCQHHIFAKNLVKFPELKFVETWILFCTPDEHGIIETGTTRQKENIGYFEMIERTQDYVLEFQPEGKLKDRMLTYLESVLENYRNEKLKTA